VLPAAFAADPYRLRRFEQKARAAVTMNHTNILAVYDIGMGADAPFIVSELLEGETLRERRSRQDSLDFGLAKLTRDRATDTGSAAPTALGHTEAWCSARSAIWRQSKSAAKPSIIGADLFTFGAILYELLSGQRAFQSGSAPETLAATITLAGLKSR
jgi:hypothetical protein